MKDYLCSVLFYTLLGLSCVSAPANAVDPSPLRRPVQGWAQGFIPQALPASPTNTTAQLSIDQSYGGLPLSFEANQGQTDKEVAFLSRGLGYTLFLTPTEAVLSLSQPQAQAKRSRDHLKTDQTKPSVSTVVRMQLLGTRQRPEVVGVDPLPGISNYFLGKDPKHWHTQVLHYARINYRNIYPGIDLLYHGKQRQLEYDFVLAPGADPTTIQLGFQGINKLTIDSQGDLVLHTKGGELRQHKPVIYQEHAGQRKHIEGRYVLKGTRQAGFQVAAYDNAQPLIIDPVLSYSTYLGGRGADYGYGIAVDSAGNAYITGQTLSTTFPTTAAAADRTCGSDGTCNGGSNVDAFVTKLNSTGTALVYSTFLGGSRLDGGRGIAVDSAGSAYIAGITNSNSFPTTFGAFDRTCGSDGTCNGGFSFDAFVVKLTPDGSALSYSTYLGGNGFDGDFGLAIAVNGIGNAFVTGNTTSTNFPTANARQAATGGSDDVFVTKLVPAGNALAYSTYLGGDSADAGAGIALDGSGNAYVTGITNSANFPTTTGAFDTSFNSLSDAFVVKLGSGGNTLGYSTYLGGSGLDAGHGIAVDSTGNAYITGETSSINLPITLDAFDRIFNNLIDAFVTKLAPAGNALVYSTYLGGSSDEAGNAIGVNSAGNAYIIGSTNSTNFPTLNPFQAVKGRGNDAFITKLAPAGNALSYSTYLGGSQDDLGHGLTLDSSGNAYITGETVSANFPKTTGAYDTTCGSDGLCNSGAADAFVSKLTEPSTAATLQFSAASYSVNENAGAATITVTRGGNNSRAVSVTYTTSSGTAAAGSDYTTKSGTISFAAGDATPKTFTVPILNDTTVEPDETVNLILNSPTGGATLGAPSSAVLSIASDDASPAGTLQFSAASYSVNEGTLNTTITVTRSGGSSGTVSVKYATSNGTAVAGSDYTAKSGTISFAAGDSAPKTITLSIANDTAVEPDETVNITLSSPAGGATLGTPGSAVLTIVSDDAASADTLQFSATTYSIKEDQGSAIITVTRAGSNATTVAVNYATRSGTASAGVDYTATRGTLTFTAGGPTSQTFSVPILNDTVVDFKETVNLTLSNPTGGAGLGTSSNAVLTIKNDDIALYFSSTNYSVNESAGTARIIVKRIGVRSRAVSINYSTSDGTASAGSDYTARSGTLNFAPSEANTAFTVPIANNDLFSETNETVNLKLSSPTGGATLGTPNSAVLTIVND